MRNALDVLVEKNAVVRFSCQVISLLLDDTNGTRYLHFQPMQEISRSFHH